MCIFRLLLEESLKNCISLELSPMEMLLFSSLIIDYIDLGILYVIHTNDIHIFSQKSLPFNSLYIPTDNNYLGQHVTNITVIISMADVTLLGDFYKVNSCQ